jgi:prepilin-type N-terminal cleavage/methylation domain-containing protein
MRKAVTIVELLVVIAIIGILIAMLLPAVQAVRESARRAQCGNNLKQLSLGVLQHVSVRGQYPTGGWGWYWIGDANRGFGRRQPGGWIYNILPYIEEMHSYRLPDDGDQYAVTEKQKRLSNTLAKTTLSIANCPSRRPCMLYAKPFAGTFVAYNALDNDESDNVSARGDYAINSGSQPFDEYFGGPETLAEADSTSLLWHDTRQCTGISFERSELMPEDLRDGTTHTIMLGEKYINPDHYTTGLEIYDNESLYTGFNNDNYRSTYVPPLRDCRGLSDPLPFGSIHSHSCNYIFCDGSMRVISYSVDPAVFLNLGNRSDGQIGDDSDLD